VLTHRSQRRFVVNGIAQALMSNSRTQIVPPASPPHQLYRIER
jgi:hypothetical protein